MTSENNYVTLSRIRLIKTDERSFYIFYLKCLLKFSYLYIIIKIIHNE